MRKSHAFISLFLVSVVWGATFPLVKESLNYITAFGFLSLRFLLALGILSVFFIKNLRADKNEINAGVILGIFLFLGYFFQTLGLKYTTSSHSGFITGLYVVFTPIFAVVLLKEHLNVKVISAVILALVGLYFLSGMSGSINFGDFLTLICAIAYAVQVVLVAKYSRMHNPTNLTIIELAMVFLLSTAGWSVEGFRMNLSLLMVFGVIFTGIFATAIGILVQTHAQRVIASSHAAVIYTIEPVFAGIFSYIFLNETMGYSGMMGAGLILLGMLLVAFDRETTMPQ